jgi:PHD/YefM family antitoxin component YafN of YafNO toxin-antitoxin module
MFPFEKHPGFDTVEIERTRMTWELGFETRVCGVTLTGALPRAQLSAKYGTGPIMNSIPAQDIKRRGISAVDEALRDGPVHVIKNNRPSYVVLTEAAYAELLESSKDAARARLRESLEDVEAGRTSRYENADALMQALDDES